MKRITLIAAIVTATSVIACTSMTPEQQGTVSGAAWRRGGAGIADCRRQRLDRRRGRQVAGGVIGNIKGSKQQ
jgi:hypothetical protein